MSNLKNMGAGKHLLAQILSMGGSRVKHMMKLNTPQALQSQKNSHSPKTKKQPK